jgi:HD-GYP domain-containing protein (c-di-GMP phosphodiesterase class II)
MSSLTNTPAELIETARQADERLSNLQVELAEESAVLLADGAQRILCYFYQDGDTRFDEARTRATDRGAAILLFLSGTEIPLDILRLANENPHFDCVEMPHAPDRIARHLLRMLRTLRWEAEAHEARRELQANREQLKEIQLIGIALSAERKLDTLLTMIVEKARHITHADAGSLYIVERAKPATGQVRRLRFKISQNDSISAPFNEFTLPINRASVAGYVADTRQTLNLEDVYALPADSPYQFNKAFDKKFAYRAKSMLVVAMSNRNGDIIGVLQLLNRKLDRNAVLTPTNTSDLVIPFTPADVELVESLASAAGVSLENAYLYEDIHNLFEGFVLASVQAIESRDPTTSGHSGRVAELTVGLAEKVDRIDSGLYGDLRFTREQLREIRYASLLHDFGKIGVREEVLTKAKKLYPTELELIEARFRFVKKAFEAEYYRQQADILRSGKKTKDAAVRFQLLEERYRAECAELDEFLKVILQANEPSVLAEGNFAALQEIGKRTFADMDGQSKPLLLPAEVINLSLRKGSLNKEEFQQIQSHVTHTFRFLQTIPWTNELRNIPLIASMHHEKLDGRGYPEAAAPERIPIQSRMMTIADIFDALTASDRPYKKAVPVQKALDIIALEVKDGSLDPLLFKVFVEAEVYRLTT